MMAQESQESWPENDHSNSVETYPLITSALRSGADVRNMKYKGRPMSDIPDAAAIIVFTLTSFLWFMESTHKFQMLCFYEFNVLRVFQQSIYPLL
jgi:hypothetical protein